MSYNYPKIGEAIAIHDALIHGFGGVPGLRDEGAQAAALFGRSWATTTAGSSIRLHSPECTLSFPFRGPTIGAHHSGRFGRDRPSRS